MAEQQILIANNNYHMLDKYLHEDNCKKVFLVCGSSMSMLKIGKYFDELERNTNIKVVKFDKFQANPLYESVVEGVELFRREACELIVAVGGGSAMDVAKCIKLYSNMSHNKNYLEQTIIPNKIKFLAIPTTAGSGSEATKYAVIYYKGEKQSVMHESCIPNAVLFDATVLNTLPLYQKKSTMLDALCHAIEAYWSVNSNEESRKYSKKAIELILENKEAYLNNDISGNVNMLKAANLAGKAINITQTTAGHAMCYKLTNLYGIAHGHAAALCVVKLWGFMLDNMEKCIDKRGKQYLNDVFIEIAESMDCIDSKDAVLKFYGILRELELSIPKADYKDYDILKNSVNPVRLKNNPILLDVQDIDILYHQILEV